MVPYGRSRRFVLAFVLDPAAGAGLRFVSLVQIFPELVGGTVRAILPFLGDDWSDEEIERLERL